MINRATPVSGGRYECGVVNCARCGGFHDALLFSPLRKPVGDLTHWAACPTTFEPVLFRVSPQSKAPPAECQAPDVHPALCNCQVL